MLRAERASGFFQVPSRRPTAGILSAVEFERSLERERSLADRGTRRFSMMVFRRQGGDRQGLALLSRHLRDRLRTTDLVGRLDEDRVAVLLTDTQPAGADVVAGWVSRDVAAFGIHVEPTIYVYPSVAETTEHPEGGDGPSAEPPIDDHGGHGANGNGHTNGHVKGRANGHTNGNTNGHANGRATKRTQSGKTKGRERDTAAPAPSEDGDRRADGRWPVKDLWSHLCVPMSRWKRSLDIVVSAIALLALLPLFILAAIAIRLDSPGPVIFRQMRAGRGARPFVFYKFRSMFVDAEERRAELAARNEQTGPVFKIHDDPRITRVGRLLRRFSIDELPQIWNVLKGDISLVGPRSPTFDEVAQYERWQRQRLNVTGGITCTWQVSGRSQIGFQEWMRMDRRYIAQRSLWTDLRLLARTLPAVISGRGAY